MRTEESLKRIANLLNNAKQLPKQKVAQPTFFEITGYPHLENVSSNVLAFYLQPNNPHQLGGLLLQALCLAANHPIDELDAASATVRTEESTSGNKRIDIVIETNNTIIGIENKIYHELNNDLQVYWRHLSLNAQSRNVMGIVLSLKPMQSPDTTGFQNITYEQLFTQFEPSLSTLDQSKRYHLFLLEFIQNIRNLIGGTTMDLDRINFFRNHQQEINNLLSEIDRLKQDMRQRLNQLAETLELERHDSRVTQGYSSPPTAAVMEFLFYTIDINPQCVLQIDIFIDLSGWHMQFWNRRGERQRVQHMMIEQDIPHRVQQKPVWRLVYTGPCPPFEADISELHPWVTEVTNQLI
ncbi:PD-(D/E)XK nuclease family protein [Sodalinema gerasimenkoae]|uniref:PD-(D/E)XK nuclease family protein n=1 Tax=Sodalinema gerasimenkoae TaxID=2862348 RepID=UPI001356EC33|nr:PD-(D/E)XK nuclease family protein [Sodalinema gerasimenkoae]